MRAALMVVATLLAVGVMAYAISDAVDSSKDTARRDAVATLQHANLLIESQQQQLQAAILGECKGRDALIVLIDATHRALHRAFLDAATVSKSNLSAVPRRLRARVLRSARAYRKDAQAVKAITQVDCVQELAHPLTYQQPTAVPIG